MRDELKTATPPVPHLSPREGGRFHGQVDRGLEYAGRADIGLHRDGIRGAELAAAGIRRDVAHM